MPGPREHVVDAHLGKPARLLRHQRLERAGDLGRLCGIDAADRAVLGDLVALAAVVPARRRRAPGVELVPAVGEAQHVGAVAMRRAADVQHGIVLRADRLRHPLAGPRGRSASRGWLRSRVRTSSHSRWKRAAAHLQGKARRQQRRVVVAELGAEPGQPARETARLDRERQQQQHLAAGVAADHHGGPHAARRADVALPGRKPIVGLEYGAVGALLERAPFLLDRCEVLVHRKLDVGTRMRTRTARSPSTPKLAAPLRPELRAEREWFAPSLDNINSESASEIREARRIAAVNLKQWSPRPAPHLP